MVETVTDFFIRFENQQYDQCLGYFSFRARKDVSDEELISLLRAARYQIGKLISIGEPMVEENTVKVWVDTEVLTGQTKKIKISLFKLGPFWKIDELPPFTD
jgi:hypothetical protein